MGTLNNELAIMEKESGLEIVFNQLSADELIGAGYRKMNISEISYIEPLFKLVPQIVENKVRTQAVQKVFDEAVSNSYKCILDPTKHLATLRGTTDVYIGTALKNENNQMDGIARWTKNDAQLAVSNLPSIALNAFNALSVVTGNYFMSQINTNLLEINLGIRNIQGYLEDKEESELKAAFQELNEILVHLQFIKKNPERVRDKALRLDVIRNEIARKAITMSERQIKKCMANAKEFDNEKVIKENLDIIRKCLIHYHLAVYIANLAYILQIYLRDITDVEELILCRNEMKTVAEQYKELFEKSISWSENYLNDTEALNKPSMGQIVFSFGAGATMAFLGGRQNSKVGGQTMAVINDLFDHNRKKKKDEIILSHEEYKKYMSDINMVESAIMAIDNYIDTSSNTAEIVSCDGAYYIRYLEKIEG